MKVAVGIVVKGKEVLLVKKKNVKGNSFWLFPGGKVESSETNEEAVVREVLEETGVNCRPLCEIATRNWDSKSMKLVFILCEYSGGVASLVEPEIFEDVRWVSPETAEELIGTERIKIQIRSFLNWLFDYRNILHGDEHSLAIEYIKEELLSENNPQAEEKINVFSAAKHLLRAK